MVPPYAPYGYGYGYGWGHWGGGGFGFFGFFFAILAFFLIIGLIRAASGWGRWGRRRRGPGGWGSRAAVKSGWPSTTASCTSATLSPRPVSPDSAEWCGGPIPAAPSRTIRAPMTTILIVDDEPEIVRLVRDYLSRRLRRHLGRTGHEALMRARTEQPDLVVLDLGLPGLDGLDVTRALRHDGDVPIIMLTARDDETDKLIGLELGADDYVTKPFSPRELVARVRAVLRRRAAGGDAPSSSPPAICALDVPRMRVEGDGEPIELTATEFALLAAMARQPGRVFTRAQLLDAIHGVAFESYERAIDAHVKNIRRKLEPDPHAPRYMLTVYGVGYRLADA